MRVWSCAALLAGLALAAGGCGPRKSYDGPTVDSFTGKLTHDGKDVSFPESEEVTLQVAHEKGQRFGVPIQPDGSFKVTWMPIGTYAAILERAKKGQVGPPSRYGVPGGLKIEAGKTEYTIELGKGWKP
jgi:hypothetical protein